MSTDNPAFEAGLEHIREGRSLEAARCFGDAIDVAPADAAPREQLVLVQASRCAAALPPDRDELAEALAHGAFLVEHAQLPADRVAEVRAALATLAKALAA